MIEHILHTALHKLAEEGLEKLVGKDKESQTTVPLPAKDNSNISDVVMGLVAKTLQVPIQKLTNNTRFKENLRANSLEVFNFLCLLDVVFDIDIPYDEKIQLESSTIGDVINCISKMR